ncbi:MAG: hypothetical protein R2860_06575 [Desulfobacterales bacterium]
MDKWEIMAKLAAIFSGMGVGADPSAIDDFVIQYMVSSAFPSGDSKETEGAKKKILAMLEKSKGPERILDLLLRTGPYGDGFGTTDASSLDKLLDHPHGIDLGPLKPRILKF